MNVSKSVSASGTWVSLSKRNRNFRSKTWRPGSSDQVSLGNELQFWAGEEEGGVGSGMPATAFQKNHTLFHIPRLFNLRVARATTPFSADFTALMSYRARCRKHRFGLVRAPDKVSAESSKKNSNCQSKVRLVVSGAQKQHIEEVPQRPEALVTAMTHYLSWPGIYKGCVCMLSAQGGTVA